MREYICDKCGRQITQEAAIKDGKSTIVLYDDDRQRLYGGFNITLKSNTWSDLCTVCILELISENINRK